MMMLNWFWSQIFSLKKIVCGLILFQKQFWAELDNKQFIYNGEYNVNGMKVGRWDIKSNTTGEYKQIAGGSYDQEGNQKKIGMWIELDEEFDYLKQVTQKGEYNMNEMKVGRWDILYCNSREQEYQQMQILIIIFKIHSGGGSYDQEGNQKKIRNWTELDEEFRSLKQITYKGEYNMNGMKVGRWDIMFMDDYEKIFQKMQKLYNYQIYLVAVDHMIKMEIRKSLESGQNCLKGFIVILKPFILENII
ncbi:unnamed protein product [Paramecium sonneborni]|uniref:Uncharacterized protein n=1 Tax=Paramecium sonneborni TaxID=65129 RepID=A0A8S1P2I3_9CILI|nr:unnamed protein product [Paramecium sonneborni]